MRELGGREHALDPADVRNLGNPEQGPAFAWRFNQAWPQTIPDGWLVSAELHWQMDKVVVNCETCIVLVTVSGDDNGTMWISLPRLAVSELLLAQLKTRS